MSKEEEIRIAVCSFAIKISSRERLIELNRQLMCDRTQFEAYSAFRTVARVDPEGVTALDIHNFLDDFQVSVGLGQCQLVVEHFDLDGDGRLSYKEFMEVVLPKEHGELRSFVTQRQGGETGNGERGLNRETGLALARILESETKIYEECSEEREVLRDLRVDADFFMEIVDRKEERRLNFGNLRLFFDDGGLILHDAEVVSFLRRVDRYDEGSIRITELSRFLRLFDKNGGISKTVRSKSGVEGGIINPSRNRSRSASKQKTQVSNYPPIKVVIKGGGGDIRTIDLQNDNTLGQSQQQYSKKKERHHDPREGEGRLASRSKSQTRRQEYQHNENLTTNSRGINKSREPQNYSRPYNGTSKATSSNKLLMQRQEVATRESRSHKKTMNRSPSADIKRGGLSPSKRSHTKQDNKYDHHLPQRQIQKSMTPPRNFKDRNQVQEAKIGLFPNSQNPRRARPSNTTPSKAYHPYNQSEEYQARRNHDKSPQSKLNFDYSPKAPKNRSPSPHNYQNHQGSRNKSHTRPAPSSQNNYPYQKDEYNRHEENKYSPKPYRRLRKSNTFQEDLIPSKSSTQYDQHRRQLSTNSHSSTSKILQEKKTSTNNFSNLSPQKQRNDRSSRKNRPPKSPHNKENRIRDSNPIPSPKKQQSFISFTAQDSQNHHRREQRKESISSISSLYRGPPSPEHLDLFNDSLVQILRQENNLQTAREKLVSLSSFSFTSIFEMIDCKNRGWFTIEDFRLFLNTLGVNIGDTRALIDLYSSFDSNSNCLLNYEELVNMTKPRGRRFDNIEHTLTKNIRPSEEVLDYLAIMFEELFYLRKRIMESKQTLKNEDIDLHQLFGSMDLSREGTLSHPEFVSYLGSLLSRKEPEISEEALLTLSTRVDCDADGVINFKDFYFFFTLQLRPGSTFRLLKPSLQLSSRFEVVEVAVLIGGIQLMAVITLCTAYIALIVELFSKMAELQNQS